MPWLRALLVLVALAAPGAGLHAAETAEPAADRAAGVLAEDAVSITHHAIELDGRRLAYTATAGSIDVALDEPEARGRIFYIAYERDDGEKARRPVTYVFNGGPGAASAYLHLLALGPRIAVLNDDGTLPPPPVALKDNAASWLAFTDLVFVDPVGTGYSRALGGAEADGGGRDAEAGFWGFEQDLDSLAEFIRLHLTRTKRWASPKFLAGESYGGFRAAALPGRLASEVGVRLSGIVLVSPVLEFSLQEPDPYRLLPWAVTLPSYAATAMHHGKGGLSAPEAAALGEVLEEVESFALGRYLTWLAGAAAPARGGAEDPVADLVRYLGLPRDLVERHRGRIPRRVFVKALLKESRRLVSLYDGTIAGIDPHPSDPAAVGPDPVLARLTAPLNGAFNGYVREELEFETDVPYLVLNDEVHRNWTWGPGSKGGQGFAGAGDRLKRAMSLEDRLAVFIAHGYYDLVTPYLASRFVVRQMALDPEVRPNLVLEVYAGGHMPYTHASVREALARDVRSFFRRRLVGPE